MEIAGRGIPSGTIRDLPPSKRFKYVDSQLGSTPCLPLPVKKRVFAPPPEGHAAAVPACLPAKKRAIVAPPPEDAVPVCLPAKKRAYAPPADAVMPAACLPAKKRVCAAQPPAAGSMPCVPAKKRVGAPPPPDAGSVPCVPAKKRVHAPLPPPEGAVSSRPVCLTANKRVMPPFVTPSPSPFVEPDVARVGALKPAKPQGSDKRAAAAAAVNPRVASGAGGYRSGEEFKKPKKPINPKEIKECLPMKPSKPRSPNKAKDLDKKACKAVHGKQFETQVEVRKKADEAARKEELRNGDDEVAREVEHEAVEEDDGVLCAVCGSTDGDPSDPIVFCDGCDLMVHATCYGNPLAQAIPDGDWFCSLCSAKKSKPPARPSCCLCPATGGAMKRTTDARWAHIACALLVPEVFFRDPDGRDGIDCSRVPAHRFAKECYICESSSGCSLECSQPKCILGFHVSCGLDGGLCIEYREAKGGAIVAGFCREHTELWEKQQLTGKYKIVARGQE